MIVTDGQRLLLGHATRSPRWDIPKGVAEPGETPLVAAARELLEETGLTVAPEDLTDLGVHAYLRGKDLALFMWKPARLPDPECLTCTSVALQLLNVIPRRYLTGTHRQHFAGQNQARRRWWATRSA